jgi:hypothetical protein
MNCIYCHELARYIAQRLSVHIPKCLLLLRQQFIAHKVGVLSWWLW